VKDFYYLVDDFMHNGKCTSANDASIPLRKKRQADPYGFDVFNSRDMAIKLSPLLYSWARQPASKQYITPFQQVWDDEVSAYGNKYPKFDPMAKALLSYNPVDGTSIDFLEGVLCNGRFGQDSVNDQAAAAAALCTVVAQPLSKRGHFVDFVAASSNNTDSDETEQLTKREFYSTFTLGTSEPGFPTAGDAIAAVVAGQLRPEYFTFFRYSGTEIEMEGKRTCPEPRSWPQTS
jgi:hypothetical protein